MRVFVTGASGFIGQAVVRELLARGHQVSGLARSEKGAQILTALGADVHHGSLEDLDSLKKGATTSDGVIHLAFIHDFSNFAESCRADREAIEAIGSALEGTGKPFLTSSGTLHLPNGRVADEDDVPDASHPFSVRGLAEGLTLGLAQKGVKAAVVRLAPTVHGEGDHAFMPMIIGVAREKGESAYIGDGLNRWPAVHRDDAAKLYALAIEKGLTGVVFHAVAEEGVRIKDVAVTIGKGLGVPVVSKSRDDAGQQFGWLAGPLGSDNPVSSQRTRDQLGWTPEHVSLLQDLESGSYFEK